jgi:hypothetical protein
MPILLRESAPVTWDKVIGGLDVSAPAHQITVAKCCCGQPSGVLEQKENDTRRPHPLVEKAP